MSSSFSSTLPRNSSAYGSRSSLSSLGKNPVSSPLGSSRFASTYTSRKTFSLGSDMSKSLTETKSFPSSSYNLNNISSSTYGSISSYKRDTPTSRDATNVTRTPSEYSSTYSLRDSTKDVRRDTTLTRSRDFSVNRSLGTRDYSTTRSLNKNISPSREPLQKEIGSRDASIMGRSLSQLDKTFRSINNPPSLTQSMTSYSTTNKNDMFVHKTQPKLRVSFADLRSDDKMFRSHREERVSPSRNYHNRGSEDNLTSILKETKVDYSRRNEEHYSGSSDNLKSILKGPENQRTEEKRGFRSSAAFDIKPDEKNDYKSNTRLRFNTPDQDPDSGGVYSSTQSLNAARNSGINTDFSGKRLPENKEERKEYLRSLKEQLLHRDSDIKNSISIADSYKHTRSPSPQRTTFRKIEFKEENAKLTRTLINPASTLERISIILPIGNVAHIKRTMNEVKKSPVSRTPVIDSLPTVPIQIPMKKPAGPSPLQKILRMADFNQKNFQQRVKEVEEKKKKEEQRKIEEEKIRKSKEEEMTKIKEREERQRKSEELEKKKKEDEEIRKIKEREETQRKREEEFLKKKKEELVKKKEKERQKMGDIKLPPPNPAMAPDYTKHNKDDIKKSLKATSTISASTESNKPTKHTSTTASNKSSNNRSFQTTRENSKGGSSKSSRSSPEENQEEDHIPSRIVLSDKFSAKLSEILQSQMQKSYHGAEIERPQLPRLGSLPPPILLITSPSAPASPVSPILSRPFNLFKMSNQISDEECSGESDYEYEEYDEWETEDDEEEDGQANASITITLGDEAMDPNSLHPKDTRSLRSTSPEDFDITLPPVEKKEPRRRMSTLPPPPIFTASVTCDGMNWEKDGSEVSDEDYYASAASRMENPSSLGVYLTPEPYSLSSDGEYDGNVDVGCVLTLVDRAAMADSEECSGESDYTYEDEEIWTEEECSEEESEQISDEEEVDATFVIPLPVEEKEPSVIELERREVKKQSEVQLPDKSSIRKAPENMTPEEQQRVEKEKKDLERLNRSSNKISSIRDRFKEITPPKEEKITYKRSSRLEMREEIRPKKTYKVIKPVINDEFDRQMAELREQMKNKETKLRGEFKDLSQGINTRQHDLNLKLKEEKHKEVIEKASESFKSAEDQKKKWIQQFKTGTDKSEITKTVISGEKEVVIEPEPRKFTKRVRKPKTDEGDKPIPPTPAEPMTDKRSELSVAQKKILLENKNDNVIVIPTKERRKSIPNSRRKTRELINLAGEDENGNKIVKAKKSRKRRHQIPKNRFTRKPFDIDDFLGLAAFSDDFDKMDEHFSLDVSISGKFDLDKKRKIGPQKVWISQLMDIDKLYRPAEIRDIKLDAFA
ncbi:unnamed protein product [Bursaphelenchus xylophilus]|uniref:(pine wood nematode) hypothetical protein n=1 Tax=Bursaphelenchus xylophilus TaxID=6326 RepID=A0A1I7S916_BURXY|nr:unnamed protein product [Bursaphelenchus xylophilus]CAG9086142.1 unnamed protein product [Bursaphelenchus xylophilus]